MQLDQSDVSEKDSTRESFLALQKRLQQSVELFQSLKNQNAQLCREVEELKNRVSLLSRTGSGDKREVAKLLDERKIVRDKVERILEALSLLESKTLG